MHINTRLQACGLSLLACLVPITARLVGLQVVRHEDFSSRARRMTARSPVEILPRGRILDRRGRVLAQSLPAWSCYADLSRLHKDPGTLEARRRLAEILELAPRRVESLARSKSRGVRLLRRKMTYEQLTGLKALGLSWVSLEPGERRFYPNGDLARAALGAVNSAGSGIAGLELAFDEHIRAREAELPLTRDAAGRAILRDPSRRLEAPPDLRLTLDRTIQFYAESALAEALGRHQAGSGSILVQDPRNGEILAMAVAPTNALRNPAAQSVYEPGSTFKIVTAAAALETGAVKRGERIACEKGNWELTSSVEINDHDPYDLLTLDEIMRHSSNIGTAKLALRVGAEAFHRHCRLFGFGYKTGVPMPAESAGLMKAPAGWNRVRLANMAFGQGIAATALQMVGAYSAVANGGTLMEPRLVLGLGGGEGPGPVAVRRVASPETVARIRGMLEDVVARGTGMSAAVPGYRVAGKTGTAQKRDPETGTYSATDFIVSFAGYAPARDPLFTILVIVDSPRVGKYASEVAAPVFSRLARQLLALRGVPPEDPLPLKLTGPAAPARSAPPRAVTKPDAPPAEAPEREAIDPKTEPGRAPLPRPSFLEEPDPAAEGRPDEAA